MVISIYFIIMHSIVPNGTFRHHLFALYLISLNQMVILFDTMVNISRKLVAVAQWLRASKRRGVEHISTIVLVNTISGVGSSPAGSVGRDLNLQKLKYQCLTTSIAVVLVVR